MVSGTLYSSEKYYDCNERIILSSIAILKLPETIIELHRRLPMGNINKISSKPFPPKAVYVKRNGKSPYLEYPRASPDWRIYENELQKWRELQKGRVNPRVIVPVPCPPGCEDLKLKIKDDFSRNRASSMLKTEEPLGKNVRNIKSMTSKDSTTALSSDISKISCISSKKNKIHQTKKGMENTITVDSEGESSLGPVEVYEMEMNSDLAELPKKTYPPGRQNLSWKWQNFFMETDEDFRILEKEANAILKSVQKSIMQIFNPDVCNGCRACTQSREIDAIADKSKSLNLIIDNVIADDTGKRYIVSSIGIAPPGEIISEDSLNQPLIISSEDQIFKTSVIDSVVVNEKDQPIHIILGISKQINHIPKTVLRRLPMPRRNVSSCICHFSISEKCSESLNNKVFTDFAKKYQERERRQEKKKKEEERNITFNESPLSETHKNIQRDQVVINDQEDMGKCKSCSDSLDKCQQNPFKNVFHPLMHSRAAKSEMNKDRKRLRVNEYRENMKFALEGVTSSAQIILAGVPLQPPITTTPVSSELETDVSAYDRHYYCSVTEFVGNAPKSHKQMPTLSPQGKNNKHEGRHHKADTEKNIDVGETKIMKKNTEAETIGAMKLVKMNINMNNVKVKEKESSAVLDDRKNQIQKKENAMKSRNKESLLILMKAALGEMAQEGYLFAKLPQCDNIPPLQAWIRYRSGFKISQKKKNLQKTLKTWEACDTRLYKKMKAPTMHLSESQKSTLTWGQIEEIRRKIATKKKTFYSSVRKSRVLQSRTIWNLVNHDKSLNVNLKKSYFIYQTNKESDGHLFKPFGFKAS
ncbi:uncharacterized protein LOC135170588 isoform X2 [Diachasmimorpha longicaudata]|uniref:uncharacterized protein LOC135170588 isoform X2 n=1 Tax=Diachasmimorpha longicaudata TaxID=58733 RepID=UPI0030B88D43